MNNLTESKIEALDDDGLLFCPKKKVKAHVWGNAGWLECGACHKPLNKDLFHKEKI
jgi:hypothetical protein